MNATWTSIQEYTMKEYSLVDIGDISPDGQKQKCNTDGSKIIPIREETEL